MDGNAPNPKAKNSKFKSLNKVFQRFFQVYELRRGHIYYRLTKFVLLISITLLTVVFSINADVVKQYDNYNWYRPLSLLEFVKSQLAIDTFPIVSPLKIKTVNTPPKDFRFLFVIDRTSSTNLNPELIEYAKTIKETIYKEAINSGFSKSRIDKLNLQEIISLRMILSFFKKLDKGDSTYKIEVGVAFYDGIKTGEEPDKFNYIRNIQKPTYVQTSNPTSSFLEFKYQGISKDDFYKQVVFSFLESKEMFLNDKRNNSDKLIDRTDFKTIFEEIKRKYFLEDHKKTIVTLFSDFHHDIRYKGLPTVHFDQVEKDVKALAANKDIYQLNLVSVPRINAKEQMINETKALLKIIKSRFNDAYYYQVNAPLLINEKDINNRICEIIAPTIKEDTSIIFYYPYVDNKLGTSKEAKACLQFDNGDEANDSNCLLSLHSKEIFDENHNLKITYKFEGGNLEVANLNSYVHEVIRYGECIDASFYNSNFVQQFGDLSIDIFPFNSQYKKRFTISFREKLSKLNAIILGTATIASFTAFVLYLLFMLADWFIFQIRMNSNQNSLIFFLILTPGLIYWLSNLLANIMWDNYMSVIEPWYFKPITYLILISIIAFFLYSIFINSAIQHNKYYSSTSGLDKQFDHLSHNLKSLDEKVSGLKTDYLAAGLGSLSRKVEEILNEIRKLGN